MEAVIEVIDLKKSYGDYEVLKGISFQVKRGETFALLGVNGAGKTTTLECLQGLRKSQSTSITIKGTCGVQLQSATLQEDMKVKEAIHLFAHWQKCTIDTSLWNMLDMENLSNKRYRILSTGQKRRVHLMLALLNNPDILFLDEPTAGLDVEARHQLHEQIRSIQKCGKTIVLATHDMQEVENLCDHIVILKDGYIAFDGTKEDLESTNSTQTIRLKMKQVNKSTAFKYVNIGQYHQGWQSFTSKDVVKGMHEILNFVHDSNYIATDIQIDHDTIETRFLDIAREEL